MKIPLALLLASAAALHAAAPADVTFTGSASAAIASGVALPADRATFWTSGTVPDPIKKDGATVYERYGDTYAQGVNCLKKISAVLAQQGLSLRDVIYLRVYVVPDAAQGGKPDFPGWFKAYGEFFNNPSNPVKTARSTVGVASLVNPDLLIEIEAVAVYPEKK